MVSLLSFVNFGEAIAYRVILWRQDPQVCSGSVRAESRWTTILDGDTPIPQPKADAPITGPTKLISTPILGGLHHRYQRVTA